ncbi:hypothetical protein EUX98_g9 [Antrodiella citrinella]|uniref:Uncharacterized protein n=1 Tax=Antrodiella citrinella TaxID=2447956 RepID=A0A4V6S1Z4_9APHY|nr:hypothetical protein EUX98_g9 [Antrodiella citrinella]
MSGIDIDDIFASSKGKSKLAPQPIASSSKPPKDKKNPNKRARDDEVQPSANKQQLKVPETIVDPSLSIVSKASATVSRPSEKSAKKRKKTDNGEENFKDSRGTGPRRKTEEGFLVYKEDELGITEQGGSEHKHFRSSAVAILILHIRYTLVPVRLRLLKAILEPTQSAQLLKERTIALRTIESANGQDVELNSSEVVLHTSSDSTASEGSPSTYLFSIPLPSDTPQCIHTATSSVTHTLTATLYPITPSLPILTKSQTIHTRRYTSHTYLPDTSPEQEAIDQPTRVELQLPRTTFKAGEAIPLYLTVPVPSRELVAERGIRLRNIRAELVRVIKARNPETEGKDSSSSQPQPGTSHAEASVSTPHVQKQHGLASSHTLDLRSVLGVPGGGEVVALSGAGCRLHPSKPLRIRLVLHPPHDHQRRDIATGASEESDTLDTQDEAENSCACISQTTILHDVTFIVYVHITFIHMSSHTERVSTISMPIVVVPPSATLPEVEASIDTAYRKKHDRPPTKTARLDDPDVPHYEAGPSYLGGGAPPPFEEREAPPPFFQSSAPSTSRLPTFLESETEIYVPSQEDPSIAPMSPPPPELRFEGEGVLFGFAPSDQFDGYNQEQVDRAGTPPPTLEMATLDPDVTELATMTEGAIGALEMALEHHADADDTHLPPPPPMDDPSDPPPSIDSDFRIPDASGPSPPLQHEAPPAFAAPVDSVESAARPPSSRGPADGHGHAPPPYAVPSNTHVSSEHQHVARPPPYVG